ncbi:PAS domain-containing protein [Alicyclobacillus acidoterrestris]|uniref:PAS domain-containing protein n=1 Tax=Alicyclobacillus acidoterrestris TaxID=1450 RepID=UPI003F53B080
MKKTVNSITEKIVTACVVVFVIWILISALLIWSLGRGFLPVTVFRVLYLVVSALILYSMLKRERVLVESRNEFNQLLNTMLEPSILHEDGIIIEVNQPALCLFGATSKEDLVGKSILDFIHPEYIPLGACPSNS